MSRDIKGEPSRTMSVGTPGKFQRGPIGRPTTMKGQPKDMISLKAETVMRSMSTSKTAFKGQPR